MRTVLRREKTGNPRSGGGARPPGGRTPGRVADEDAARFGAVEIANRLLGGGDRPRGRLHRRRRGRLRRRGGTTGQEPGGNEQRDGPFERGESHSPASFPSYATPRG